ncbi:MAG: enolase C-terminal domain-like protein [Acidimicrobiales bacterium]
MREYGYTLDYFRREARRRSRRLPAGGRDALWGLHVWLGVAPLAEAAHLQISGHCAPNLHAPAAAATSNLRHVEYFHNHHHLETVLFTGTLAPTGGTMTPAPCQPGHGLTFCDDVASVFRVA